MSRRRKWEQEEVAPVKPGLWARIRYLGLIVLSLLAILYVAGQVMARTAGFRDLVGQRLEARLGLPVKIEGSSVNWRFDLTLDSLVTEGTKRKNSPGLRARRVHLAWSFRDLWRRGITLRAVELDRCAVVFGRAVDGGWTPREFQPLSDVLGQWLEFDLRAPARDTGQAGGKESAREPDAGREGRSWRDQVKDSGTRLTLDQAEVTWWGDGDTPLATVEGIGLNVTPVRVPGRELTHVKLEVRQAVAQSGDVVRNLHVELLDIGSKQMVLGFEAERQAPAKL